jgi:hypothetical protein
MPEELPVSDHDKLEKVHEAIFGDGNGDMGIKKSSTKWATFIRAQPSAANSSAISSSRSRRSAPHSDTPTCMAARHAHRLAQVFRRHNNEIAVLDLRLRSLRHHPRKHKHQIRLPYAAYRRRDRLFVVPEPSSRPKVNLSLLAFLRSPVSILRINRVTFRFRPRRSSAAPPTLEVRLHIARMLLANIG